MADQSNTTTMSPDELQAFAGKLQRWGQRLDPKEQQFLAEMLGRAAGEDVQGFAAVDMFLKITSVPSPGAAAWYKEQGPFVKIDAPFLKITDVKGE